MIQVSYLRLALVCSLAFAAGCTGDPSFPTPARDSGIQCSPSINATGRDASTGDASVTEGGLADGGTADASMSMADAGTTAEAGGGTLEAGSSSGALDQGCPTGQVCLSGHCVPQCMSDTDCSIREMCDSRGVCVARTTPLPEGGVDAGGPTDPCTGVVCDSTMGGPVCHPLTGTCVQCQDRSDCGGGAPICDMAYGMCRAFTGTVPPCSPCNTDLDCMNTDGSVAGTCVARTMPYLEQVCVPDCDSAGACPPGMACDMGTNKCFPKVGSCTGFLSALSMRSCTADADCVPLGAAAAPGTCSLPAGAPPGVCLQPCGTPNQCPAGFICDGSFCHPATP